MARGSQDASMRTGRGSSEREAYWRQAVGDWSRSGLSKVAFCRERDLSPSGFHWWKGELARRDAARLRSRSTSSSSAKDRAPKAMPAFVAVRLAEGSVAGAAVPPRVEGGDGVAVEVVLGNGRRVRVGSGFDAGLLARVVSVLEGLAC
jgi:hypothetical protein